MTQKDAVNILLDEVLPTCSAEVGLAIKAIYEEYKEQRWIPVSERLPDPFVSVLGYCPDEDPLPTVHECYMNGFGQWCSAQVYGMENVTQWKPMPNIPEEDVS